MAKPQTNSLVYVGMTAEYVHPGIINVITVARSYGEVIVGLLTDSALANRKRIPLLTWEDRRDVLMNIVGVKAVVPQEEWNYAPNLRKYQPKFMVHGDDWLSGSLYSVRAETLRVLAEINCQLVEIPYTDGFSSSQIASQQVHAGLSPSVRCGLLRRTISAKNLSRYIEVHSPISAVLAERSQAEKDSLQVQFDGFWSSSLADSTLMGRPDIEALDISSRLRMINDIFDVTSRPLIMDIDTGGQPEHLELNLKSIERLGISAVVLEDKVGLKKNSLLGNDVRQIQSDIDEFANKISLARRTIRNSDFMVIGRIESLILDKGMSDALMRSDAYVDAGADGILIHSRKPTPDEVFTFAKLFKSKHPDVPLIAIPSTYSHVIETELEASGFNVVIYANQLIRASCQAIEKVLKQILDDQTAFSSERDMINLRKLLEIIPGTM